jgi:hypothetical protein
MRFAFVGAKVKKEGWGTEYGRPDLGYMLKEMATGGADGKGIFGRRTCVFVCGPPTMRVDVANTVARLQADIWGDDSKDEIFLHTENYAIWYMRRLDLGTLEWAFGMMEWLEGYLFTIWYLGFRYLLCN